MSGRVHLSPPDVGQLEESYLINALRSGWIAPVGPEVTAFERDIAERAGCAHAVAVSSGTAALHLALLALGVRPGQVVVVPTMTFVASANAVVYTGAEPVFVDSEPNTGNIDPALLAALLETLRAEGRSVAAVMAVDLFGACADYTRLLPVCDAAGVPLLEDAAESLGAAHGGRPAGSFGRAGVFSFNGNKIITTSGGGMLVSDDGELVERCRHLATQSRQPVVHYEHHEVGYNYRLSNLLAALGRAQLTRLDEMRSRRRQLRERYAKFFAAIPGVRLLGEGDVESNCWLTCVVVDPERSSWPAADLAAALSRADIETRPLWKPMHRQPVYAGARAALNGVSDRLFAHGLALPSGSAMDESQEAHVFRTIERFLERG